MYRWSTEVLFFSPQTKDCEMMSGAHSLHLHGEQCIALESKQSKEVIFGKADSHTEGVFGGWTCCISCGRFTRGFRLFGLLLALLICTTKNARTTMAPRKAKTGMVCPTSWLYRPGIIPRKAKRQRLPREPRWLCGANATTKRICR